MHLEVVKCGSEGGEWKKGERGSGWRKLKEEMGTAIMTPVVKERKWLFVPSLWK